MFTDRTDCAILSRYEKTPMPGYLVTPAGSLVYGEFNYFKEEIS